MNLYRKASDPQLTDVLRQRFCGIPDKWYEDAAPIQGIPEEVSAEMLASMRERHRDDFAKSFDETWAAINKSAEQLAVDPVAEKLKTFRDKYHAHLEMSPLGADPAPFDVGSLGLTYNDLLTFADRYMEAAFEMNRLITGTVTCVADFTAVHREHGIEMWHILAGLPSKRG